MAEHHVRLVIRKNRVIAILPALQVCPDPKRPMGKENYRNIVVGAVEAVIQPATKSPLLWLRIFRRVGVIIKKCHYKVIPCKGGDLWAVIYGIKNLYKNACPSVIGWHALVMKV